MRLADFTGPGLIFPNLQVEEGAEVLRVLSRQLQGAGLVGDAGAVFRGLIEREQLGSTGIGGGIAIPHCKLEDLEQVVLAIAVVEGGVDFAALDGEPVRYFFLVVSPESTPAAHLQCLAAITRWAKDGEALQRFGELASAEEMYALLAREA